MRVLRPTDSDSPSPNMAMTAASQARRWAAIAEIVSPSRSATPATSPDSTSASACTTSSTATSFTTAATRASARRSAMGSSGDPTSSIWASTAALRAAPASGSSRKVPTMQPSSSTWVL